PARPTFNYSTFNHSLAALPRLPRLPRDARPVRARARPVTKPLPIAACARPPYGRTLVATQQGTRKEMKMASLTRDMQAFADHHRMASFFDGARAGRDDIAYGAYPSLGREPLTAPKFRDGFEVARAVVNIVGVYARDTYIVQDVRRGDQ